MEPMNPIEMKEFLARKGWSEATKKTAYALNLKEWKRKGSVAPRRDSSKPPKNYIELQTWAQRQVVTAIRRKKLPNLADACVVCVRCRQELATEYDHRNYFKPLEVSPVCRGCNRALGRAHPGIEWRLPRGWTRKSTSWYYAFNPDVAVVVEIEEGGPWGWYLRQLPDPFTLADLKAVYPLRWRKVRQRLLERTQVTEVGGVFRRV